jgi:sn-glycerol 3-phosphate transport system ATP-binding protein
LSSIADPGEFLVLLGPSGCGKSTTLRLIAGLDAVTSGQIRIAGRDVTHVPPGRRALSMVFQSYALFPHLSVAENIVFGLRLRKVAATERARRLTRVAELLGIRALLGRKPGQLSGGQQQRVALARALVAQTPICLMDEPLSNLDAQLRGEMRREIRELQQRLGITMVYVTHDQTEAMTMADRVVLMRAGGIEQAGTPAELYERPATVFAARFVGAPAMNILPDGPQGGGFVGVRPERVRVADAAAGFAARVRTIEYLGADTVVGCEFAAGPHQGARIVMRAAGRLALQPGAAVYLGWAAEDAHCFDATGARRAE